MTDFEKKMSENFNEINNFWKYAVNAIGSSCLYYNSDSRNPFV